MRVRYTETALREVDEIFAYIVNHNVVAAAAIVERVEELVGQLGEFPFMAQETDIAGVRKFPLGRFPYSARQVSLRCLLHSPARRGRHSTRSTRG